MDNLEALYLHGSNLLPQFGPTRLMDIHNHFESFQKAFDAHQKVDVLYKGTKAYEVKAGEEIIVSYDIQKQNQKVMWFVSGVFAVMALTAFFYK